MTQELQGYIYSLSVEKVPETEEEFERYRAEMQEDELILHDTLGAEFLSSSERIMRYHFPGIIMLQSMYPTKEEERAAALSTAKALALRSYPPPLYSKHNITMTPEPLITTKDGMALYILHMYSQEFNN